MEKRQVATFPPVPCFNQLILDSSHLSSRRSFSPSFDKSTWILVRRFLPHQPHPYPLPLPPRLTPCFVPHQISTSFPNFFLLPLFLPRTPRLPTRARLPPRPLRLPLPASRRKPSPMTRQWKLQSWKARSRCSSSLLWVMLKKERRNKWIEVACAGFFHTWFSLLLFRILSFSLPHFSLIIFRTTQRNIIFPNQDNSYLNCLTYSSLQATAAEESQAKFANE